MNSVVLPAPLGPMRPTIAPASTVKLTRSLATSSPNFLVTSCTSSSAKGGTSFFRGRLAAETPGDVADDPRDARRLLDDDDDDQKAEDDQVHAAPEAAPLGPRELLQGHEHRRPEQRSRQGPRAAQDRDEHELHRHVERHDHAGVDAEVVLHEEGAAQGRERRRQGHGRELDGRRVDAERLGSLLALAHGPQVVAEPVPLEEAHDAEDEGKEHQRAVEVARLRVVPHQVGKTLLHDHVVQAQRAAHPVPDEKHPVEDLHDGEGGDGEVVAAQLEAGVADEHGHDGGREHADEGPRPGGHAVGHDGHARAVGADAEEHGVPEGRLPAVAADDVPGLGHAGVEQNQDEHVHEKGVGRNRRDKRHQGDEPREGQPEEIGSLERLVHGVTTRKCPWASETRGRDRARKRPRI